MVLNPSSTLNYPCPWAPLQTKMIRISGGRAQTKKTILSAPGAPTCSHVRTMKPSPSLKMWKFQPKISKKRKAQDHSASGVKAKALDIGLPCSNRSPLFPWRLHSLWFPETSRAAVMFWPIGSSNVAENLCVCVCVCVRACACTGVPLRTVSLVGKTAVKQEQYESYVGSEKWENQTL